MTLERRFVPGFIILVFVLSSPLWFLGNQFAIQLLPGLPISALAAFTPAVSAMAVVYISGRSDAARNLLRRLFDARRIKYRSWYIVIVLFNPTVALISFDMMRAMHRAVPSPSFEFSSVVLLAIFFTAALGEEIGWTGYATKPFLERWGILLGGILLGFVWVAFHLIPLIQSDRSLEWILWWSLGTLSLRTIMFWLYVHAGDSVFAAAVFHAMINVSWQLFPIDGSFYDPRIFSGVALTLGLIVAIPSRLLFIRNHKAA